MSKRGTCWQGYEQKGMKKKGNKMVPNCVPAGINHVEENLQVDQKENTPNACLLQKQAK